MRLFPPPLGSVPLDRVRQVVRAALHIAYDPGVDGAAWGPAAGEGSVFDRAWLGQHAATVADSEAYGYTVVSGTVSLAPGRYAALAGEIVRFREEHPIDVSVAAHNPFHYAPPKRGPSGA